MFIVLVAGIGWSIIRKTGYVDNLLRFLLNNLFNYEA